ncbi:GGDEF domain-containing phosphodiesterase [Sporosarcina sp. Te-1]|uniref:GGDEF domain-containing phosphodiesterase n=1 Tax=Sporosarcina sp. Te-1 TaxID=2818390 RepID=UPI001A9CF606|nr:GGDEF domain-containing phosphodiesterase [Sporosarcina sp. Te-1]QTD40589.1 EAL domain-containing protein [Sporosarcina sp. Te-1]
MLKSENDKRLELPDIMESLEKYYMVTRTDGEGLITYANRNFLETSNWTPKRILGKSFWQMFPNDEEGQEQSHAIWSRLSSGKSWFGTTKKTTRHGDPYFVKLVAVPFMDDSETLSSATFLELDVTDDVELREKLQEIAFIDFETGLMSRHRLETLVNEYIESKRHFSFVYITIDHYYTLKDHKTYDSERILIKEFTNRLKRYFQDSPIARVGVGQFALLTPFGDWYIQGFLAFLKEQPIYIEHTALPLSISGGIVRYPEDQQTYTQLITAALAATKEMTDSGGGRIASLSAESHKGLNRRALIDRKLLTALDRRNLQVVYQPQYDVASKSINLYEALVRWEDEELGYVMPDELIPIAEENGQIHAIGAYVIEEAAKLAAEWDKEKRDICVSINSSVREFSKPDMKNTILDILRDTNCPANRIRLEITEKFAFQAEVEQSIIRQMQSLQDAGVQFILDDFGTGYASFRYMQNLPISRVKIDQDFIQSLTTHPKTKQLVEGMIMFCKSMGLTVSAEGVETQEQFDMLIEMGVDAIQGYYIGTPVTQDQITFE